MDFEMFFGILILEPKWGFCMGYSLCMMTDFENALISRIFGVFWSGFLDRTTVNDLLVDFDMFFGILIFEPKWGFCMGYSLCMMADFENALIFGVFGVVWSSFLQRTTVNDL